MAKKVPKKPRNEHIGFTTKHVEDEIVFTVEPHTGDIQFITEMENVHSEVSYYRQKGPKVQSRLPQGNGSASFDTSAVLRDNFDFRCAVDTNTLEINGKLISVVGIVEFQHNWIDTGQGLQSHWRFEVPFCLEYVELKIKPENFGWLAAYYQLLHRGNLSANQKVAIVVDSDLGNLHDYNERRKPIFDNEFLPPNVVLIYASGEIGTENVLNKTLAVADSLAKQSLDALKTGKAPFNRKPFDGPWCEGFRIIRPYK